MAARTSIEKLLKKLPDRTDLPGFSTCLTDFEFPFVRRSFVLFVPKGGRAVKNFWRSWARSPLSFWRGRGGGPFENIENSPPSRTEREPTAFERNRAGAHRIRKKQSASRTERALREQGAVKIFCFGTLAPRPRPRRSANWQRRAVFEKGP